jgi:uncharacterized protein
VNQLPNFRYHPDPLATGSIERSDVACAVCSKVRGYIYVGHVHVPSDEDLRDRVCPWCIADGTAHERFDATFADEAYVGGRDWCAVPSEVAHVVATRTPSFTPWQNIYWFACCGDAAAYWGRAGHAEIVAEYASIESCLRADMGMTAAEHDDEWAEYFHSLDKDNSPTAYVFRCLHCGTLGGFSDCD